MAKDIRIYFSRRLRELRTNAGMTQEQLAKKANISVKYLQNLESHDPKNPTLFVLDKLATALNISIAKFLDFN